jgi:hypothetical protein
MDQSIISLLSFVMTGVVNLKKLDLALVFCLSMLQSNVHMWLLPLSDHPPKVIHDGLHLR